MIEKQTVFTRTHQILIGVLALQLVLTGVILWPKPAAGTAGSQPLLGTLKTTDITALTIHDDQKNTITLAKQGDGWVLADADGFPADATKVNRALTKLVALRTSRPVATTQASYKRLQVADDTFVRKLDIQASNGISQTIYVGSSPAGGSSHVRLGAHNEVYLASGLASFDVNADAASWINTTYVDAVPADAVKIDLKNANGEWTFTKDAGGNWTMTGLAAGETLATNNVESLLNQITGVRIVKPLGKTEQPAYGLAQPLAVVTLTTKKDNQETNHTLSVGAKDSAGSNYFAKSSTSTYYVDIADYNATALTDKKRTDFLLQPTPTPAAPAPAAPAPAPAPSPAP